ncbi:patatin-like phospholipase family protein [Pedococcus sp. NPDC057267]|uniref:patatin-like phospholipase family protein n=1 Tax=Pedococcus sp. NPDC057267 TaxID=3346077 RepID=UPI00363616EA
MPRMRALVLAGGGAAGNAWELGLLAGLADAGLDVTDADVVIGTSAGSTVAAQVTSGSPLAELYAAVLAESAPSRPAGREGQAGPARGSGPARGVTGGAYLDWSNDVIAAASDPADMRRRMGAAALERMGSDDSGTSRWRDVVASRLPGSRWPDRWVLIAAVDARTGEPVVFDRDSGVDLVDAVAASTSAMTPYRIGERWYLNGGYRRSENADLAAGCERVLVLSPFGGRSRMPAAWGMDLATQVRQLREAGSRVETVFPDAGAGAVFDANALDPSNRPQAARGGFEQGRSLAATLAVLWR